MFKEIFSFELKQNFRKPSIYIYFSVFFLLNLLIGLVATGYFATTRSDSNFILNSSFAVAGTLLGTSTNLFGLIGNILLISIMATAIQKDYEYNTHPLFFTKPITKFGYFFGRFFSSFLICILVFSGLLLGYYVGLLHGIGTEYVGTFKWSNFLNPFLIFIIPNVLLLGAIFFSLTTYLRSTMMAYIVAIVLMVLQIATGTITSDIENKTLAALLEPTGSSALQLMSEYWSPAEKNVNSIPLTGILLQNRLIWLAVAFLITIISYRGFSFSQFLQPLNLFKSKQSEEEKVEYTATSLADLPKPTQIFTSKASLQKTWYLGLFEFKKLSSSLFFIVMMILSIGVMLLQSNFLDSMYETPTYLVTYKAIGVIGSTEAFAFIFIIFYSGTIVWRERETRVVELIGSSPISNTSLFTSKFIGLLLAYLLFKIIGCLFGISLQLYHGFYNINLGQYGVFIFKGLMFSCVTIAACLVAQVLSNNKYLGFFYVLAFGVILPIVFSLMEWDSFLLDFNGDGSSSLYSDMNGYGNSFIQFPFYRLFWMSATLLLCFVAILAFARGKEKGLIPRFKLSSYFFTQKYKMYMLACVLVFFAVGSYIYYEERVMQVHTSAKESEKETAEFEKKYKKYEKLLMPRIVATKVNVDLFTSKKELHVEGIYTLKNKHNKPLDTLYIDFIGGEKSNFSFLKLEPKVANKVVLTDQKNGIKIIKLNQPLQPNDSIDFAFEMWYKPKSYYDKASAIGTIVDNGTFINNNYFPSFGYNEQSELSQNTARKEYGLAPKERMAKVNDSAAMMNTYISNDADWIQFETTVSTDEGQTAIAPGYLQKEWKKDGRHYFTYKMDSPILNFYSFLSAKYEIKKDKWNGINLEIYYNKGHEFNIDRMMNAMKKSLDYYTKNFGPYQHKQVRIIEFPRYSSFAQSFPNTIPFSESIGFIVKVDDKNPLSIDVPFYVTAHEVAHQWWAHQVIGANVQGSVLMSETMSQYSALMVMEKEYGKDAMKKFLKYEMDSYLQGRTFESKKELPLMLVENQQYIHYNKGSVIMYALKDYIGEENLNNALKAYINKVKFQNAPYTTAFEFMSYLYKATPDSLQYLVKDMFERITLYENYVKKLDYKKVNDSSYIVSLTVGSAKFYADNKGNLKPATVNDYIDIGIFTNETINNKDVEKPLVFEKIKMDSKEKTFTYTVKKKPFSAGIDPYLKLIDRTPKNNTCKFGSEPEKPNLSEKSDDLSIMLGGKNEED
jgi:ABC-2 type transport system permease protein